MRLCLDRDQPGDVELQPPPVLFHGQAALGGMLRRGLTLGVVGRLDR